jgi:N-acyl-D-aspartate/D-glutamate deacylase
MLDLSVVGDLNVEFLGDTQSQGNPAFMGELMASQYVLPGVSDGGAHTKFFTGGSWPTDILRWLVREQKTVTLEQAHFSMSYLSAHAAGFRDRGMLKEGAAADVIVYDLEEVNMTPSFIGDVAYDLPGSEWRRIQRPHGYHSIIVNGEETFVNGECTGKTPGRLLRHGRG